MTINKPNLLIVGAAKAGTTSLAQLLGKHQDVFLHKIKEPRYFVGSYLREISDEDPLKKHILDSSVLEKSSYFKMYDVKEKIKIDASVHYLYHHEIAIKRIKKELGDVPIIIMIRNPINRLVSNYNYLKSYNLDSIEVEIFKEQEKKQKGYNSFWFLKEQGLYSHSIKAYKENFSEVKIILFEEFVKDTSLIIQECLTWLGLSEYKHKVNFNKVSNPSIEPNIMYKVLKRLKLISIFKYFFSNIKYFNSLKNDLLYKKAITELSLKQRLKLEDYYKRDIMNLEKQHNLNLYLWRHSNDNF